MPNWCMTKYIFHGDKEELDYLKSKIDEAISGTFRKTDFGRDWLGNILIVAGLEERIDSEDPNKMLRCRGTIIDISDVEDSGNGYTLEFFCETAWVPMARMWDETIKAFGLKTVGFEYEAEESGCDLYWIYDPNGYGSFDDEEVYIDAYSESNVAEERRDFENLSGYRTAKDVVKALSSFFNVKTKSMDNLIKLCDSFNNDSDREYDAWIYVHFFERIDILED